MALCLDEGKVRLKKTARKNTKMKRTRGKMRRRRELPGK